MKQKKLDEIITHMWESNQHPFVMEQKVGTFESFYNFFNSNAVNDGFDIWPYKIVYQDINDSYAIKTTRHSNGLSIYVHSELIDLSIKIPLAMNRILNRFLSYCHIDFLNDEIYISAHSVTSEYLLSGKECHNASVCYNLVNSSNPNIYMGNFIFNWYKPNDIINFNVSLMKDNKHVINCNIDDISDASFILLRIDDSILDSIDFKKSYSDVEIEELLTLNKMVTL
jgi:hypothetical protein